MSATEQKDGGGLSEQEALWCMVFEGVILSSLSEDDVGALMTRLGRVFGFTDAQMMCLGALVDRKMVEPIETVGLGVS